MPEIINPGRSLFAAKQGAGLPLNIDRFVLAYIPGLDPAAPVNLNEALPTVPQTKGVFPISGKGYVSPDRVVYSLLIGPLVGPFEFNWVGLLDEDDTLVAVSYIPTTQKYATAGGVLGNSLTRNFLIEYQNAQSITGITVEAGTWQIDFIARFNQQTDLLQTISRDFFGTQFFVDDGFKVIRQSAQWKISAGVGYVGGIRIANGLTTPFDAGDLPADIWLDVYLDKNISSVDPIFTVAALPAGTPLADYTAPNGVKHFVAKIATLTTVTNYVDLRRVVSNANGVVADLYQSWVTFLADFGGKTDYLHLTADTNLEKNTRVFSDADLEHVLPEVSNLNPGDVIRCKKKFGAVVTYAVFNLAADFIKLASGDVDTSVYHDIDSDIDFLWTGTHWEV